MSTKAISGCDECGWTSKVTAPACADRAYKLHSCERKRRDDAAAERSRARDAAVDRTPKPCPHKRANHQHGTYACYVLDFCRCLPCASANSNYEVERVRRIAYGRPAYVDAGPAREHVRALMAAGLGWKRVAERANVANGVMTKLLYGEQSRGTPPSRRIRPDTAARILAVTADRLADGQVVDGTGTRRRLQALVVAGWPQARLAERLGMNPANFGPLILGQRNPTVATARRMAVLYDELWDTAPAPANRWERGASNRARRNALARGWVPALAWDEDTIDDPTAAPAVTADEHVGVDEVAVLRRAHGDRSVELSRPERWLLVQRLHAEGMNDREIAARTGLIDRQILRDRQALGLPANTPGRASA